MLVTVAGPSDEVVARRVMQTAGLAVQDVHVQYGKHQLDAHLARYNRAAQFGPWFVLRDLNSDADCAPALMTRLLPTSSAGMRFRLAVRTIEAWLMADSEKLGGFLAIDRSLLPARPESVPDPKLELVNLARRSRKREIREDMVPEEGVASKVGARYAARLIEFASRHWRSEVAAKRSDSLARCIRVLKEWGRK